MSGTAEKAEAEGEGELSGLTHVPQKAVDLGCEVHGQPWEKLSLFPTIHVFDQQVFLSSEKVTSFDKLRGWFLLALRFLNLFIFLNIRE